MADAVLVREGQTWFYKLMGDAKVVDAHAESFEKFVKEVVWVLMYKVK